MTIRGNMTYNRYRVRRNTTEPGFSFTARNDQVSQTLLIPGLDRLNPLDLFSAGQPGGFVDPYDLTQMWVDDAGTTPMTLANLGTGPGRVIAKGHTPITLVQANAADRPVWGRHPVSGIRNLITWSEDISNAAWVKNNVSVAADGEFWRVTTTVSTTLQGVQSSSVSADSHSGTVSYRVTLKKETVTSEVTVWLRESLGTGTTYASTVINLVTGQVTFGGGTVVDLGDRWELTNISTTVSGPVTIGFRRTNAAVGAAWSIGQVMVVAGGTALLDTYQRVTNRFDVTEVGSPSLYYFSGNGVNQRWRSAANLDLSGVNVMTVWAGVRTNQGSTRAAIYSHNTDAANFSQLEAPGFTSNNYEFSVRTGLTAAIADVLYTAPTTDALAGVHNRDARQLWRNGVLVDTGTGDSGANNLPNAPLDIFFRGSGPDRFFNGNLYSYIIAGGAYDTRTIQRFSDYLLKPRRLITA